MKELGLTTVALSVLLLSGCGGESGKKKEKTITEQISEHSYVAIIHGTKKASCELFTDAVIQNAKQTGEAKDIIMDSPANTVSCATYGKVEGDYCANETLANMFDLTDTADITILEDNTKACVIAFNL